MHVLAKYWRVRISLHLTANVIASAVFCFVLFLIGIFGQGLEDTVQYEKKFGVRLAPLLVEQCVNFIRERGLDEEGLFRMPGQANLVKELQDAFDCGEKPQFDRYRIFGSEFVYQYLLLFLSPVTYWDILEWNFVINWIAIKWKDIVCANAIVFVCIMLFVYNFVLYLLYVYWQ